MTTSAAGSDDLRLAWDASSHVAWIEVNRPPHNFLDLNLLEHLLDVMTKMDADPACHVIVVGSAGKNFCAGRDFTRNRAEGDDSQTVYQVAARLLEISVPWIAVVQGAAVGAGFGLALCADFRVASTRAYFAANFVKLGLHHGFGTTVTLPRVVGRQKALNLLLSGRRIAAEEALACGLVDRVVEESELHGVAEGFAASLASSPRVSLQAIKATLLGGVADDFRTAATHEALEQDRLRAMGALET